MDTQALISLPVINLQEYKCIGVITNIYVYRKKLKALLVVDDNMDEYIIFTRDIYAVGSSAVTIRNNTKLILASSIEYILKAYSTPLGYPIVSSDGNVYSNINNIVYDNHYNILQVCYKEGTCDAHMLRFGSKFTVINQIRVSKPKIKLNNTDIQVHTLTGSNKISDIVGKYTTKDILTQNGEVVVKKGIKITPSTVAKAINSGKLKELQLNNKKV